MGIKDDKALYLKASKAYYNEQPIMSDAEFDKLEAKIRKADPEWKQLAKTGVKVADKKTEVRLPKYMPSLGKCYPENIDKWLAKRNRGDLIALHKYDGSALIVKYFAGRPVFVATRGDGTNGGDISFLIPHLNLPNIKHTGETIFRCEAVMKNKVFLKKYADDFENPRNAVNGWLNRKTPHKGLKDVDIVVLGVYNQPIKDGLHWAATQGFTVAVFTSAKTDLTELLATQRTKAEYDIDGLVLVPKQQVFAYENADKPKWTTAFKVNDEADAVEAKVKKIIWQDSRNSRLTPKIEIEPVKMKGVTVTFCTAHNAAWMNERGIGVGAVVKLVRSGDVIPKIVGVVKKAKKLSVPDVPHELVGKYYVATVRSLDAEVREIHHFFSVLGIEHIASKTVAKLYEAGFTSVLSHVDVYGSRMKGYTKAGVGEAMTGKIYGECSRVFHTEGVTLRQLMVASNCFDVIGDRKLKTIEAYHAERGEPNVLARFVKTSTFELGGNVMRSMVYDVPGFSDKTTEEFFDGIERFKKWFEPIRKLKVIKILKPVHEKKAVVKGILTGMNVSFTGYRDKDQEKWITDNGGEVVNFGSKTTILLYKDGGKSSTKVDKARDAGKTVYTFDELKRKMK